MADSRKFDFGVREWSSAAMILALGLVGYYMPHLRFGPYGLLDLKSLVAIVFAIGSIQFASHLASVYFGATFGRSISGLVGGFVSSTAVFVSLVSQLRAQPDAFLAFFASALFAVVAMLTEAVFIVALTAPPLASQALNLFFPMIFVVLVVAAFSVRLSLRKSRDRGPNVASMKTVNPASILKTALLLSVVFFVVAISNRIFGARSAAVATFLTGLFEIHAVVYATSDLFVRGELTRAAALGQLAIAASAGILSKVFILTFMQRGRFAVYVSIVLLLVLGVGLLF